MVPSHARSGHQSGTHPQCMIKIKGSKMKITKSRLKQIIKEEIQLLNEFRIPRGFVTVSGIPIPGRESDLEWLLKQERDGNIGPMQYNQNNGVIIVIPKSGARHAAVYIPESAGGAEDATRSVSYAEAKADVEAGGYKLNTNLYVPFSN